MSKYPQSEKDIFTLNESKARAMMLGEKTPTTDKIKAKFDADWKIPSRDYRGWIPESKYDKLANIVVMYTDKDPEYCEKVFQHFYTTVGLSKCEFVIYVRLDGDKLVYYARTSGDNIVEEFRK